MILFPPKAGASHELLFKKMVSRHPFNAAEGKATSTHKVDIYDYKPVVQYFPNNFS
jgi:hypothetical protein